ncbi:hypothetical protein [uncultured Rikenella sp.]|uniref:phage upper tail fiber protein n=1 Tax=uncultured Rikenella sp. TaxID=368003 RepID=UPI00262CA5DC|nr:hypothetical protein [uncultured Rikenella sp.]
MATQGRALLKSWFKRGLYPKAEHFADWIDSFWHKEEDQLPIDTVENLPNLLNEKYSRTDGEELEHRHDLLDADFSRHQTENAYEFSVINEDIEELEAADEQFRTDLETLRTDFETADRALLTTLRDGADEGYDTLRKLQTCIETINQAISGTETPDVIDTLNEALAFIREHQNEIESLTTAYLKKTAIADDLATDDATRVLSARQGAELLRQINERAAATDLATHISDTARHITEEERTAWHAKLDASHYTAEDVLAKLLTVDGSESDLAADTVDGIHLWKGTEEAYEALETKDENTLYIVQ